MSISKKLERKIKTRAKKKGWAIYSERTDTWSFYATELSRIKCNYPEGFMKRFDIINVLKVPTDNANIWDFFCAIMFWGGVESDNFNKFKGQEKEIVANIKTTIKCFSGKKPDIKEAFVIWCKR